MGNALLTIFTPTYNRINELERLYSSLISQTDFRFEWLIVDDGSTDDTENMVISWLDTSPFPIRYIKQPNSGKHVAHNLGAAEASGEYFICVDSDDWLEPNAVETILHDVTALDTEEGLLYPKLFAAQTALDTWFPDGADKIELADMRMKYGLVIETAIVFDTDVLRRHPFPVVQGERFTKNIWKNWLGSPVGTRMALVKRHESARRYSSVRALRERISALVGIESLNMAVAEPVFSGIDSNRVFALLVFPLSVLVERRRFVRKVS